uniref:Uncharacterized protein n=1 Tax=Kalanchoe fedtschenkoi TaxID=63787 RepID=A0A7N0ZZN1_KALFE
MVGSKLAHFSAALLAYVAWIFFISRVGEKVAGRRRLPPGPRGLSLLGYLLFLGADLHLTFAKLGRRHGPIFKL